MVMSPSHSRPMTSVCQVISIPLLVDSICLHLLPRDIPPVLLVSKAFHAAFLSYRWSTLEACPEKAFGPRDYFPKKPSSKLAMALLRYGAKFVQHLVLGLRAGDLINPTTTYMDRMTELVAQSNIQIARLRSLTTQGVMHREQFIDWMHWDSFLDHTSYDLVNFLACDVDEKSASAAVVEIRYENLSNFNTALALTLVEKNFRTLQQLCLEGFINSRDKTKQAAFSVRLIDAISRLENLRSLQVGRLPLMDVLNLLLNLPSRVQELVLLVWMQPEFEYNHETGQSDPDPVEITQTAEQAWSTYQRNLKEYCNQECIRATVAVIPHKIVSSSSSSSSDLPTIQLLLKNMKVKTQLRRLSLNYYMYYPTWVLYEILRHCPNLNSFKVPLIMLDNCHQILPNLEGFPTRIEHLDLSNLPNYRGQIAKFLHHFKPAPAPPRLSGPAVERLQSWHRSNQELSIISSPHPAWSTGLRSFTILSVDDQASGPGIREALALHYQSLTRISILGCGNLFDSKDVITLLECCPCLEILLTMNQQSLRDTVTGESDDQYLSPTVNWTDFIPRDVTTTNNTSGGGSKQGSTLSSGMTTDSTGSGPSTASSRSQPWPCAKTLKVLSIAFMFETSKSSVKGTSFFAEGVYERLGQLENLEDLAVAANWIHVPLTPKRYPYYKRVYKNQNLPAPVPGAKKRIRVLDSLSMSLAQGLGHLKRLKKLRRLNVSQLCLFGISRQELVWMYEHWPAVEVILGLKLTDIEEWSEEEYDRMYATYPFFRASV